MLLMHLINNARCKDPKLIPEEVHRFLRFISFFYSRENIKGFYYQQRLYEDMQL